MADTNDVVADDRGSCETMFCGLERGAMSEGGHPFRFGVEMVGPFEGRTWADLSLIHI